MPTNFLHHHKNFRELLLIIGDERKIDPALVEKDYWIKHALYGMTQLGLVFELKGGTSLSKAYQVIHRFSEDIDIHIQPPPEMNINENPNAKSAAVFQAREAFFHWLAYEKLHIDGLTAERDTEFDDKTGRFRNAGIRLRYQELTDKVEGIKDGILLEAGFDVIHPNEEKNISSWAYDRATATPDIEMTDNRALAIKCYHPGYTLVEKLQAICTKYRREKAMPEEKYKVNFMRQYYDVSCLLDQPYIQEFIGTDQYKAHKAHHFPKEDLALPIAENDAFLLSEAEVRQDFRVRYESSKALYYQGQPTFDSLIENIQKHLAKL